MLTGILISFNALLTGNIFYGRLSTVIIVISSLLVIINVLIIWRIGKGTR